MKISYSDGIALSYYAEDSNCLGPKKTGKTVIGTSASPVSGMSTVNTKLV